ncbi:MAG: DUF2764 domain-containing protein [Deltaproteobacteria bacterium]|nr:DUF2764 domain-containing protein [Deltaproteobacteria bacterium]
MGAYYFLICLLPPLPSSQGDKLSLPFSELSRMVRRHILPADEALLKGHLAVIDAANFEHREQGRDLFLEGGSISREDLEAGRNLPEFIRTFQEEKERGIRRVHLHDRLWELCYEELLRLAEKTGCRFLLDYIPWEIELRNRLTALRLREGSGNVEEHAVLPGIRNFDFTALLSQIEAQKNPLAVERYLDGERLKQIYHCQGNDPFSLDALLAYVSRAMIYGRWEKLQEPYDMKNFLYGGG